MIGFLIMDLKFQLLIINKKIYDGYNFFLFIEFMDYTNIVHWKIIITNMIIWELIQILFKMISLILHCIKLAVDNSLDIFAD